ncbi:MAG: aminopeptidase [Victivallales bacterium]|nr:aminopeptidase [Victivallales bacterium]
MAPKKENKKKETVKVWKQEQGWDKLSKQELDELDAYCREYVDFITFAKTERLAHDRGLEMAIAAGFKNLDELPEGKLLKPGTKVYRSCHGKTLFLAQIGKQPLEKGLIMVGAHIDSPRLDAKPNPICQDDSIAYIDTHYYGGIKKYQWLTMPLAIYGVVFKRNGEKVDIAIGDKPDDPVFNISDLLPHLDYDRINQPVSKAFNGEALNVIIASRPVDKEDDNKDVSEKTKLRVLKYLEKKYGIEEEDFASAEIEIVPAGPARFMGIDRSMVLGYGQDDRVCAFGTVKGIIDAQGVPNRTRAAVICDKEEIGSYGSTGMDSTFIENSVAELVARTAKNYSDLAVRRALENSMMLSSDVNSLHDPLFADVSSPHNMAKINCGIVLTKYTGSRGKGGSSDASAEYMSKVRTIFNNAGVIWQIGELGKVDVGGGGTIAHYLARYGMDVVDCGVGLLSMHAPHEIAGTLDIYMAYRAYKAFYEAD